MIKPIESRILKFPVSSYFRTRIAFTPRRSARQNGVQMGLAIIGAVTDELHRLTGDSIVRALLSDVAYRFKQIQRLIH